MSRKVARREARKSYENMSPKKRVESDAVGFGCLAVAVLLALLFGLITGNWQSVGRWLSR